MLSGMLLLLAHLMLVQAGTTLSVALLPFNDAFVALVQFQLSELQEEPQSGPNCQVYGFNEFSSLSGFKWRILA